ncbi:MULTISPECIES: cysteine-rich CWC family protein [unclassified Dysgonomonas]|uniref:cysteine-rich CWC family protein n=1 Tax=unclassified Dysgonomonas TaxID=2630389 RepID=UPI0013EE242B|nr:MULTISPECIES: cysteine-rich CWC family protein [unclassified Dysgonomonas]
MKKICQKCSTAFACREDRIELCQCSRISLNSGVRDYIKDNYDNCLCPECLKETNAYFNACVINPAYLEKINKAKIG